MPDQDSLAIYSYMIVFLNTSEKFSLELEWYLWKGTKFIVDRARLKGHVRVRIFTPYT